MVYDLCATAWCEFVKYLLVQTTCHANKIDVHCSCKISDELNMVSYITKENKIRKRGRIVLMKQYFESTLLAMVYLSTQRGPRDLGCFTDDEHKHSLRKYLLKDLYDGAEVACYDQLRLTKRKFHDLCAMLRAKCALSDNVYVTVEEKVTMFLHVLGHGLKMRLLRGQYSRSLWTNSTHFPEVLKAILSLHGVFIKLPDPSVEPPNDYKWKWFPNALGALDGCHVNVCVNVADQGRYRNKNKLSALTCSMLSTGT
jgi:hypothetical protein